MSTGSSPFSRFLESHADLSASDSPISLGGAVPSGYLSSIRQRARVRLTSPAFDREEWIYTNPEKLSAALADSVGTEGGSSPESGSSFPFIKGSVVDRNSLTEYLRDRGIPLLPSAIICVNGVMLDASELSSDGGVTVLAVTSRERGVTESDLWRGLGSLSERSENPFVHLNEATLECAVQLRVGKNRAASDVVQLVHLVEGSRAAPPRTLIVAEQGASVSVFETIVCLGEDGPRAPAVTEIQCAPGAHCSYSRLLDGPPTLQSLSSLFVQLERAATCQAFVVSPEGGIIRTEIHPSLVGEGASMKVAGLSLGTAHQHSDTVVSMDHAAPHCESRQLFKGIYAGRSTGAFSGTIIVREGAQKTNAFQSSKSILVSPDASVNTKPRLKIWADDVKCSHGATVGQLDEAALFYLRSRGVPLTIAKTLLLQAFVGEVLGEITSPEVREVISGIVEKRMQVVLEGA